ncbi:hypothetical protein OZZ08_11900 [Malaciobacter mytili]|uniref:hypothetical protein n=1 Tax=Malaciobacter mytili TaxID=603050 RepID=UPI003BB21D1A
MLEVSFKINGKKVNPNNIKNQMEAMILKSIEEKIKKTISSIHCNEHNQRPKILVIGSNFNNLSFEISGCCENIIEKTKEKLK